MGGILFNGVRRRSTKFAWPLLQDSKRNRFAFIIVREEEGAETTCAMSYDRFTVLSMWVAYVDGKLLPDYVPDHTVTLDQTAPCVSVVLYKGKEVERMRYGRFHA